MRQSEWARVIAAAMGPAAEYLDSLPTRRVYRPVQDQDEIRAIVGGPLPERGTAPEEVVASLARDIEPYITAHASGRFFGFVIGGLHPAAYGAELLTTTWDQNAALFPVTPGVAVVEDVATGWLLDLLDLPSDSSVGLVTGGADGQLHLPRCGTRPRPPRDRLGRRDGRSPRRPQRHSGGEVGSALDDCSRSAVSRLGDSCAVAVDSDEQARIDPEALERTLRSIEGPTIVCLESANINTGSFDPFDRVADLAQNHRERGNPTWVHVDGAIGLWARVSPDRKHLTAGLDRLDSWSTDAHKLLNVGYDSGVAICRNAAAHRAATNVQASYLIPGGK